MTKTANSEETTSSPIDLYISAASGLITFPRSVTASIYSFPGQRGHPSESLAICFRAVSKWWQRWPLRQGGQGTRTCMCVRHREISACRRTVCQARLTACARARVYLRARDSCNTRGASVHVSVHASPIERENLERREEENAGKIAEWWKTCGVRDEMAIRSRLVRPASSLYIDRNALVVRLALRN